MKVLVEAVVRAPWPSERLTAGGDPETRVPVPNSFWETALPASISYAIWIFSQTMRTAKCAEEYRGRGLDRGAADDGE